ncbi:MAG: hypothetical protein UT86_C0005G0024 [Candidatus Magasanikbacteria bacterium GW2011_GWC2_40_17]|uniref:Uncharacterized protein n=1 Tax=Candidatus Magasanikbacteria bacterium GW2011_GWA2_42_32 TaxID=1619039 RepID=A0A0G1A6W2_9BACT|nr:MAG: hypothetical protein UT86_C0005G0024 [Candidatus Magasanikbacteria bacterium GW2011_GWC2_40_17]KKS56760.1 MAG: hypothetical protein UV20_C0006G0043 [Candidatus Magasanikbacteria bacterium GW2011_GWA2_42_32]OGH86051.1 MAG: hypothetical protein A2294_02200 [Candidatus Magasanikbacteria bacterium RIFOXYB2_FULL_38_10]
MENKEPNNLEKEVMSKITSGKIKLRSRYIFLAEKLGLDSVLILTVVLAVLFFNLILFYLKSSDNLNYLSFGSRGLLAFWETFPYPLIIVFIVLILGGGFFLKRSEFSYKKPFGFLALALIGSILMVGAILTFTGLNEKIEKNVFGPRPGVPFSRWFLRGGLEERHNSLAGLVVEMNDGYVVVQTPRNLQKVDFKDVLNKVSNEKLYPGVLAVFIGEKKEEVFFARDWRVLNQGEIPLIDRNIHRRFGSFEMKIPADPHCLGNCLNLGTPPNFCWQNCNK